jgi:hypothetical protein
MARTTIDKSLIGTVNSSSLVGTTTNDSAAAGLVGQYIESIATDTVAVTSTNYGDLTSISLTAGDWDVSAVVYWDNTGATWTLAQFGISTTSGNSGTGLVAGQNFISNQWASSATTPTILTGSIAPYRMSLASTTTVYLKYRSTYSAGGPPHSQGRLSARRVR